MPPYRYQWRAPVDNVAVEALHAEAFGHDPVDHDWAAQLAGHSLGWVCAFDDDDEGDGDGGGALVGFVNVAWDGDLHAFVLDTAVAATARRQGVGAGLVRVAAAEAAAAGCGWLHVDFDDGLAPFYLDACGFQPVPAGLLRLR